MNQSFWKSSAVQGWVKRLLKYDGGIPKSWPADSQTHFIDLCVTSLKSRRVLNTNFTLTGKVLDRTAFDGATPHLTVQESADVSDAEFILNSGTWESVTNRAATEVAEVTLSIDRALVSASLKVNNNAAGSHVTVRLNNPGAAVLTSASAEMTVDNLQTVTVAGAVDVQEIGAGPEKLNSGVEVRQHAADIESEYGNISICGQGAEGASGVRG